MWYLRLKTYPLHWWPNVYAESCLGMWLYVHSTGIDSADAYDLEEDAKDDLELWERYGEIGVGQYEVVFIGDRGDGK